MMYPVPHVEDFLCFMSVHSGVHKHQLLTMVFKCVRIMMEFSETFNAVQKSLLICFYSKEQLFWELGWNRLVGLKKAPFRQTRTDTL